MMTIKVYIEIAEKSRTFDGNGRRKLVKQSEAVIENVLLIIGIAYCIFGVTPAK